MAEIFIDENGDVACLAIDDLDLRVLGPLRVRRASHVEFDDERQLWVTTLPNGWEVGAYATRREALDAEVTLLNDKILNSTIEEVFDVCLRQG